MAQSLRFYAVTQRISGSLCLACLEPPALESSSSSGTPTFPFQVLLGQPAADLLFLR